MLSVSAKRFAVLSLLHQFFLLNLTRKIVHKIAGKNTKTHPAIAIDFSAMLPFGRVKASEKPPEKPIPSDRIIIEHEVQATSPRNSSLCFIC
jgi:S-adenosylmethionine:tRNA-ribosyltransferase-isomerase (queuine synthetase)